MLIPRIRPLTSILHFHPIKIHAYLGIRINPLTYKQTIHKPRFYSTPLPNMSDYGSESESDFVIDSGDDEDFVDEVKPTKAAPKKAAAAKEKAPPKAKANAKAKIPLNNSTNTTPSAGTPGEQNKKSTASSQYQKLSQLEHILKRPDTYVGSVERLSSEQWVVDEETGSMVKKTVSIVPGLFKIFDEILVNAADNKIRDPSMKRLEVTIDGESNTISVKNDGKGIPVEIHDKEGVYIPELIFGNLLTSSNYDDDEKKVTGGRNGYGAKLCNIFSTEFTVETADKNTGQNYKQTWTGNMGIAGKPKITKMTGKTEFTKITFKPDLAKFGMETLDADILGVLRRRVYDLAGSVRGISVYLNGQPLKIKNFKQYVEMYVRALEKAKESSTATPIKVESTPEPGSESSTPAPIPGLLAPPAEKLPTIVHQIINDRWEIAFSVSDGSFNQVSFVNSIATTSGGTHVNLVSDLIIDKITEQIKKKNKKAMIKPFQIRNNMFVFINCLVENPAFTSQTKEQLTTRATQYGGKKLELPDDFVRKVLRTGIVDSVLDIAANNADKALKKTDGNRKNRITGYPKLEDANRAGTNEGRKCTLILTEGDSALSLAVAGLAVVGRDYYGCYPLRGKMLNVREASADQIMKNAEIQAIKQIMGLQHKKKYDSSNINSLRYGHIMIMTDQDHDGSHIKGLIINFLETSFPGLLEVPEFLIEFITPIVKVTLLSGPKKRTVIPFYTMPEYEHWRETEGKNQSYKQKYYKGLGTSSPTEAREYFSQLDKHLKKFHALQEEDKGLIDLAFSKKKADDRKEWLRLFQPGTFLDPTLEVIPISDFINKELILFSMADNIRSIPSVVDGYKPSQRKILYGCYKRNLTFEIKVSQLAGYIGEHTGYHHGEQSLVQSIVSLAQDFVGSNNLNVLKPLGAFGSRAAGGKDASAARYISTELQPITKKVFNPSDNQLLTYVQDDEQTVEPEWYIPIIPMVLVNGSEGIGSGWSTSIPPFNPRDIVKNIRALMNGEEMFDMMPWFKGWEGNITRVASDRFRVEGLIQQIDDNTFEITELPARMWTITMKEFLLQGLAGNDKNKPWIKDMEEQHGVGIKFIVKLTNEEMAKTLQMGPLERFKLVSSISTSNMVAFDPQGRIKRYDHVNRIIEDYFVVRLDYYQRRKDFMAEQYSNMLNKLSFQAKFVKMIIDEELIVANKKRAVLIAELQSLGFPGFDKNNKMIEHTNVKKELSEEEMLDEEAVQEEENGLVVNNTNNISATYDYLLGMQIWSLTRERYEKLLKQRDEQEQQLSVLLLKSAKDLWNEDLDEFLIEWDKFLIEDEDNRKRMLPKVNGAKKTAKRTRKPKTDAPAKKVKTEPVSEEEQAKGPKSGQGAVPSVKVEKKSTPEVTPEPEFKSVFGKSVFGQSKVSSAFDAFKKTTPTKPLETEKKAPATYKGAKKAAPPKKKKTVVLDSDDDEDSFMEDLDDEPIVATSSRPIRERKSYKSYDLGSDDDEISVKEESDDSYNESDY